MSQDFSSPQVKTDEVDLDDLEVNVLIIGKNPTVLNASASFLTRRGWPSIVIENLSAAVEHIADKEPDFVLVSLSHPNPSVVRLPELVTQTFNLMCVVFVETLDQTNQQRLAQFKIRHKVQGLPSGPNLQRTLRKVLSERFQTASRKLSDADRSASEGAANVTIKGSGGKDSGTTHVSGNAHDGGYAVQGGRESESAIVLGGPGEGPGAGARLGGDRPRRSLKDIMAAPNGGSVSGTSAIAQASDRATDRAAEAVIRQFQQSLAHTTDEDGLKLSQGTSAEASAQDVFQPAVAGGLKRACHFDPEMLTLELAKISKLAVFPVNSPTHSGYLVMAAQMAQDRIDEFFMKHLEACVREELSAAAFDGALEAGFWLHLPEVHFRTWTSAQAEFTCYEAHESGEVGLAFFPLAGTLPRRGPVELGEMMPVTLDEISTDQPVTFKAYLHLEKNQKYFLYLKDGRVLQPEQKQRLKNRRVNRVFMRPADADNLRQFLAGSFLRGKLKGSA